MLVTARWVIDRVLSPRSRADEIRSVRRRLSAMQGPSEVSREELRLAREMRELRRRIAATYGDVAACAVCVRPRSRIGSGGFCCGGRTERLFTDDELAALKLSGTKPGRLKPPRGPHLGCAFRGVRGCSLGPADRPNLCMRYACRELIQEIERRGDGSVLRSLHSKLQVALHRFVVLRGRRCAEADRTGQ